MKNIIFILVLFITGSIAAQDYVAPEPNERQKTEAKELAKTMDMELSFTEKQLLLVEKINATFNAQRDQILGNQDLSIADKNEFLRAMYVEQGREMSDVLVREQLDLYERIRGEMQPLVVIEE
ncbi:hypothetical protein SAMN05192588_0752 [Nonlabens sp. Hel1_33_55]|uniref:hypothetical protein n=1 Tax=Nonlabens sp. Hel1_33_55 TaxID=1336802 RepID=UPI000875CF54|nr:hypothetical protein [Nonlabens sp. Hel1_33_55]SCY01749.1 hypothetical protein SAMN05192588_0752 [Nonlabens sp. Hel1_33_55]